MLICKSVRLMQTVACRRFPLMVSRHGWQLTDYNSTVNSTSKTGLLWCSTITHRQHHLLTAVYYDEGRWQFHPPIVQRARSRHLYARDTVTSWYADQSMWTHVQQTVAGCFAQHSTIRPDVCRPDSGPRTATQTTGLWILAGIPASCIVTCMWRWMLPHVLLLDHITITHQCVLSLSWRCWSTSH